jgi:dTDP-4-dehydrorhamnose 3,5-epimerase-like enzyme
MKQVKLVKLPSHNDSGGNLVVAEALSKEFPFEIKRIFNVQAAIIGSIRGKHAHIDCTQLLICTNGVIEIYCESSTESEVFKLSKPDYGLLIYPGVWSEQKYLSQNSVLTVLCDHLYDEDDYIRDYKDFKKLNN